MLDRKWAAYVLTGAALAAPGVAQAADIQYAVVNQTFSQPGGGPNSYRFDFGAPAVGDMTLSAESPTADTNSVRLSLGTGAYVWCVPGFSNPAAMAAGELIDPAGSYWGTGGKLNEYQSGASGNFGKWANGTPAYLGFYFSAVDGKHMGWAHLTTNADASGSSFTVLDYAYQTNPDTAIAAGEGEVPEPSSMALLALGAAGLVALRRRRAGNA